MELMDENTNGLGDRQIFLNREAEEPINNEARHELLRRWQNEWDNT